MTLKFFLLIVVSTAIQPAQAPKYDLLWRPQSNSVMAYKLRLEIDAQPEKFSFLADLDSKVLRVKPNGDYDVETSVKNSHVKHGLHDEPINDSSKPTVDTYNHLGHKIASTDDDDPTEESNPALNSLDSITDNLTPDKPVGIGDTWTVVLQPNAKLKREAGKVVYTLSGIEKQGDYQTLKIVYKYKETEKDVPLTAEGYVMVSQSDFSLVRLEGTLKGAKLSADPDFPNGDATLSLIRN